MHSAVQRRPQHRSRRGAGERPDGAARAAVDHRVERGGADEEVGDPGGEAELRAPGAEQHGVEEEIVELGARRLRRAQRTPVEKVRIDQELHRHQRPGDRPGAAALPEVEADDGEAEAEGRRAHSVVGVDQRGRFHRDAA
jgi:hypothetical protein